MSIIVSGLWRWHMFELAKSLAEHGQATTVFNADFRRPELMAEVSYQRAPISLALAGKLASKNRSIRTFAYDAICRKYDSWVGSRLEAMDEEAKIFHAWSSFHPISGSLATRSGAKWIVERSGAHVSHQDKIVKEEMDRWGIHQDEVTLKVNVREREVMLEEYEKCDHILTCSTVARNTFVERGIDPCKVSSITLGCNFAPKRIVRPQGKTFRLLSIGIPSLRKGFFYLLEAWKRLALPGAELHIISGGMDFFDRYRCVPNVFFHSPVPRAELSRFYESSSAFCLPSVEDGFGLVVPEAMSFGLPVLVSDAVGALEIVANGENGFVFESRNIDQLCEKIVILYEDEIRRRAMGVLASSRVSECTWSKYGLALASLYDRVQNITH